MYLLAIIGTLMLIQGASEIDRARKKLFSNKNYILTTGSTAYLSKSDFLNLGSMKVFLPQ